MRKAVMRLCAFTMVHNDIIGPTEENIILEVIQNRSYCGKEDAKPFYEECKDLLLTDELQQQSIFVNIDSLDKQQIRNELNDFIKIAKADNALVDAEREAFVLICKLLRLKDSRTLWRKGLEKELEVQDIAQRPLMLIEDFRNIKKIIGFYHIKGPVVEGARHVLQMEYTKRTDLEGFKEHLITHKAFLLFCSVAFLLFIHFPSLGHILEVLAIAPQYIRYCETGSLFGVLLIVFFVFFMKIICKKDKKKLADVSRSFQIMAWCAFGGALLSGLLYHDMWVLSMMLSIEWLIFMREKHSAKEHNSSSMLIVLVAIAIIADIALGVTEHVHAGKTLGWDILSGPVFLGCICFFFGKWLENNNTKAQGELKEMETIIAKLETAK